MTPYIYIYIYIFIYFKISCIPDWMFRNLLPLNSWFLKPVLMTSSFSGNIFCVFWKNEHKNSDFYFQNFIYFLEISLANISEFGGSKTVPRNYGRLQDSMQRTRAIPVAWLSSGLCPDRPKG